MVDKVYPKALQAFGTAGIDWVNDPIKALLIGSGYTYSDGHQYLSSIASGDRIAISTVLTGRTATDGMFVAANPPRFTGVSGTIQAIGLFKDTGSAATSPLIAFLDGVVRIVIAQATTSTSIAIDPIERSFLAGVSATRISGTGATSFVVGANVDYTATPIRSLSANASVNVVQGAVYELRSRGLGLPLTTTDGNFDIDWGQGTGRIFSITQA